jgi:hypothetical protein
MMILTKRTPLDLGRRSFRKLFYSPSVAVQWVAVIADVRAVGSLYLGYIALKLVRGPLMTPVP